MRILFINEKCGYLGGVEQNIAEAATNLRLRGHECFLLCSTITERQSKEYAEIFNAVYLSNHATARSSKPTVSVPSCIHRGYTETEVVVRTKPDVLYFHKIPTLAPFVNLSGKIPIVRMIHDHDLFCPRRHKYFLLGGQICPYPAGPKCYSNFCFIQRAPESKTGIALKSIQATIQELRRNSIVERILVGSRYMRDALVMNGIDSSRVFILPPVVSRVSMAASPVPMEPHILSIGQLIRGKGIDLLLRAVAKMKIDFRLSIVGTGNAEFNLKQLTKKLGIGDRVSFVGWVPHDQVAKWYQAAKVVVVPSRWPEPFGMNGLEAMTHGRPVVGFDVGGIPDWISHEENGLLVPPQDVSGLKHALTRLLTNNELAQEMGTRGREMAEEKFSFNSYLDQLENYLNIN